MTATNILAQFQKAVEALVEQRWLIGEDRTALIQRGEQERELVMNSVAK